MPDNEFRDVAYTSLRTPDSPEKESDGGEDDVVDTVKLDTEDQYVPADNDEFVDPRLKDYPIPLVAKTVDLHNDPTEPTLTFRFWILSTFWVIFGCTISSIYYFKTFPGAQTGFLVQLLSGEMGNLMARHLPDRNIMVFSTTFNLNPGPWNAKEHALVVAAFWGSSYTAYGLGPLSAMELYYGMKMHAGWAILFLVTTQLMGYGIVGLFRDVLVRPPQMYYAAVLPMVSLFNAMHKNPSIGSRSFRFFCLVATGAFIYQWLPSFVWPMLGSLPILCYLGAGNWKAFLMGSGTYGFGLLDVSLDWNYMAFFSPLYVPLWANLNRFFGATLVCWLIYPIMYFTNTVDSIKFAPMSAGTWDKHGQKYNVSAILTPSFTLNRTALALYSQPYWSISYSMHFFWGFAASSGVVVYAILFHGELMYKIMWADRNQDLSNDDDPYIRLMAHSPRVPHSWYMCLLGGCVLVAIGQLYGGDMQLPWWGLLLIVTVSAVFTLPSGILFGIANLQIGVDYVSELIAGLLFPEKPVAVLVCMVYGRQCLTQCLNLVGDLKFAFYMKIPEQHMFIAQVYGTLLGPFVNYFCMRIIIDTQGPKLLGSMASGSWSALKTKNFYSLSVLWGIVGPKALFGSDSPYQWIFLGFALGPVLVIIHWALTRSCRTRREYLQYINPVIIMNGAAIFPVYPTTNLMTSMIIAFIFMGVIYRYYPAWFRKYNNLLGAGLDCGTQLMQLAMMVIVDIPGFSMPEWWGNDSIASDRCFPPKDLPANALN